MKKHDVRDADENESVRRRSLLQNAGLAVPLLYTATGAEAAAPDGSSKARPFPGVITRQKDPDNVEFPFATLSSFLTSNEQFYIRTHFQVPELDPGGWKLKIEGHVERAAEVTYEELRKLPARTIVSLLECSGNSRVLLEPPQLSIRWEQGGVANAEWTGVRLSDVLEKAGVKPGAVEVILEGHDKGKFDEPNPKTPGEIHYARSLPLEKARQPEVLLAWRMNGEDLPPAHGYPVRAVVAGWYGMASVKWLRRIIVTDRPFHGYFQTFAYAIWERRDGGLPSLVPVSDIEVKAQIARPALQEVVAANSTYRVFGAAWSGKEKITKVDISTDGGRSWAPARLDPKSAPFAWRFFDYEWKTPSGKGKHVLMARATDEGGSVQPMKRDKDRRDAVISHVQKTEVFVR